MTTRLLPNIPKTTHRVWNAGAHRGARGNLSALANLNRESERMAIEVMPVDPIPGRAMAFATEARALGLTATPTEGKIEEVVATSAYQGEPKIFNVDRASTLAVGLAATESAAPPVLFYLILVLPSGRMAGLRGAIAPEETRFRAQAKTFFDALAKVSERAGSKAIWGAAADPAHLALEPSMRSTFFAEHCKQNLAKFLAGLEIESPALEICFDPSEPIPLHVVERDTWGDPYAVVEGVAENPDSTIARGQKFVVAEVTPLGVRLHESARRSFDAKVVVKGTSTIDEASTLAHAEARAQVVEALRTAPPRTPPLVQAAGKSERSTTASPRYATAVRDAELTREASLVFATALVGAARGRAATASVRTNELSRVNPIRTTD